MNASSYDPVIGVALDYERAVLDALAALRGANTAEQRAACLRYAEATKTIGALSSADYQLVEAWLTKRNRIPKHAVGTLVTALEAFAARSRP